MDGTGGDNVVIGQLRDVRRKVVAGWTASLEGFRFNRAVALHMELTNALYAHRRVTDPSDWGDEVRSTVREWLRLLAPFAPHLAEELWEQLGNTPSIFQAE